MDLADPYKELTCDNWPLSSIDVHFWGDFKTLILAYDVFSDGPTNASTLKDGNFSMAHSLESLWIFWDGPLRITQTAFTGLSSLIIFGMAPRTLNSTPPELAVGWLDPLWSLKGIFFSDCRINGFGIGHFCGLKQLEILNISNNSLTDYHSIGVTCNISHVSCHPCLPNMTYLDISHNRFSTLDINFATDIPRLKQLISPSSNVSYLYPVESSLIIGLETIDLSNNNIPSFDISDPENCTLSNLHDIQLQNNKLSHISESFFNCTSRLESLDLSRNMLTMQDLNRAGLANLKNLSYLYLHNNRIGILSVNAYTASDTIGSDTFPNLEGLKVLDLSSNFLLEFKVSQPLSLLETLNLQHNRLNAIPDFSSNWSALDTLDLSRNNISDIPEGIFIGLQNLTSLSLAHNRLSVIHLAILSNMKSLKKLDLGNNAIHILTDCFPGLTDLILDNNKIKSLLPRYNCFRSLQSLHLSNNLIDRFADIKHCYLDIRFLDLSRNHISLMDYYENLVFVCAEHLHTINLTYNRLQSLPSKYLRWHYMDTPNILLQGNPLRCDCGIEWLAGINSMRQVILILDKGVVTNYGEGGGGAE